MDALRLTSAVGPGPGGRRERPTIGLLIGNLKRHADTERPRPDRTELQTSRKTGSVIRPGEGGLTGILFAWLS